MQYDKYKMRIESIKKYYSRIFCECFDLYSICKCVYDILDAKFYRIVDNANSELNEDELNLLSNLQIAMSEIFSIIKDFQNGKYD